MSPQRLTALADGVFAIAMTLLVLELSVPVVTEESVALGELLLVASMLVCAAIVLTFIGLTVARRWQAVTVWRLGRER